MTHKTDVEVMQLPGDVRIGVIFEQAVNGRRLGSGVYVHGSKRPLYILLGTDGGTYFWKSNGEQASVDKLTGLFPAELDQFRSGF